VPTTASTGAEGSGSPGANAGGNAAGAAGSPPVVQQAADQNQ
jgi:hypothetical protein